MKESQQIDFMPARVQVLRHIRLKYACPCCRSHIRLAEKPAQILPKSRAAPSLLAHIACAKYVDGLPLNRQEKQFHRLGLNLPRATTANWMIKLAEAVIPVINLLNDHLLDGPLIHCDETTLQVLRSDKAPSSDHFMWMRAGGSPERKVLLFDYAPSRSAEVAKRLLLGFKGILLTDGYEADNGVAEAQSLVHAGCLAHARRYFKDVTKAQPEASGRAHIALDYIGKIYDVERELRQRKALPTADEWLEVRQQNSAPIMIELKSRPGWMIWRRNYRQKHCLQKLCTTPWANGGNSAYSSPSRSCRSTTTAAKTQFSLLSSVAAIGSSVIPLPAPWPALAYTRWSRQHARTRWNLLPI